MSKAYIEISWNEEAPFLSVTEAIDTTCDDLKERLSGIAGASPRVELALDFFPYPRLGVAALVIKEGGLLMLQRHGSHGAETWYLPGGDVEYRESPEDAAVHGTRRDTGVTVQAVRRLGWTNTTSPYDDHHDITLFILCTHIEEEPVAAARHRVSNVGWVLLGGVHCRELSAPLRTFLDEHPHILHELAQAL